MLGRLQLNAFLLSGRGSSNLNRNHVILIVESLAFLNVPVPSAVFHAIVSLLRTPLSPQAALSAVISLATMICQGHRIEQQQTEQNLKRAMKNLIEVAKGSNASLLHQAYTIWELNEPGQVRFSNE